MYKVYEIKKRIFDDNDQEAEKVRKELKEDGTFLINLMSSPGGGKTTTLKRTIDTLKDEMRIGVMEADIDSAVDADAISETGAKVIQLHTGGMCPSGCGYDETGSRGTWNGRYRPLPYWKMWATSYVRRSSTQER